jgi:hypothetical protein
VPVIGEGQSDVTARPKKIFGDLQENLGVLESHLRHELTCGEVSPPLDLKKVAAR